MTSLGHSLAATAEVELTTAVACPGEGRGVFECRGISHYRIPVAASRIDREIHEHPSDNLIQETLRVVGDVEPDLVHVHGTECFYGLLLAERRLIVPAVVSIQGLLGECNRYHLGGMSFGEIASTYSVGSLVRNRGILHSYLSSGRRRERMERRILDGNHCFIGRTTWDRAHLRAVNADAAYFKCDEMLREPFYSTERDPTKIRRFSLYVSTAHCPLKGFHVLLKAAALLKKEFRNLTILVADQWTPRSDARQGYPKYLHKLISDLGLTQTVCPLGPLDDLGVATEMARAHAVVVPSFVENASQALAEGMIMGVPCVASFSGGMPSVFKNGETALGFPPGDEAYLAECIRTIFLDDTLAHGLGQAARATASVRLAKETIVRRTLEIYREVLNRSQQEKVKA